MSAITFIPKLKRFMRKLILILSFGLIVGTCHGMSLFLQQDSIWTLQKCIEHAFSQNIQIRKSENLQTRDSDSMLNRQKHSDCLR